MTHPTKTKRRPIQAAVLDHTTGQMRKVEPATRPERMSLAQVQQALEGLGLHTPMGHKDALTEHVTLSARQPWVEGKGWLDVLNPRTVYPDGPSINWIHEPGQPQGVLDVWLDGLAPDTDYLAQIHVGSAGAGTFDLTAVTLGGGYSTTQIGASGAFQTLLLMFGTDTGGLGLVRVTHPDWSLYDVEIDAFG